MVLVPDPTPLAIPAPVMVATAGFDELQLTVLVRFWVLPSLYVPVAVNGCVVPVTIDGLAGVTAIDDSVGGTPSKPNTVTPVGVPT